MRNYSVGLQLSLQTTPPERTCILLINCSVKRFISDTWKENIYLKENIHAYVKTEQYKYCRIALQQKCTEDSETGKKYYTHFWSFPEQQCYNLYYTNQLPCADEVLHNPEIYINSDKATQILLPYKYGMDFSDMHIGIGIPIKDKSEIFHEVCNLMKDFAEPVGAVNSVSAVHLYKKMNKEEAQKLHRERLKSCTGMPEMTIEIYGHDTDNSLRDEIFREFKEYLGDSENDTIFSVNLINKELGALGDMMADNSYNAHLRRIEVINKTITKEKNITGALIILENTGGENGDPKNALRAGFADVNRLTQFITPDKENNPKERIHGAVMDILRQFGYSEFIEKRNMKKNPAFDADVVGMYAMHEIKPLWAKSPKDTVRFLPVYITYQVRSGKIMVNCDIFEKRDLSYPEALLEFSKLSRNKDFSKKCNDVSRHGFRTKLMGLYSLYREKPALLMIQANGTTRLQWYGITDKKISEYKMLEDYVPEQIETGTKSYSFMKSFGETGIRIMRIRENKSICEVPDYYTQKQEDGKHIASSGIYQYKKVFWGLENRPKNKEYLKSYQQSKFQDASQNFDECRLVEFFPVQLQHKDNVEQWVAFSNYLRELIPETNRQAVRLPLPLHFAELMQEYLLISSQKNN